MKHVVVPVADYRPPSREQMVEFVELVDGESCVLVHCNAGMGRFFFEFFFFLFFGTWDSLLFEGCFCLFECLNEKKIGLVRCWPPISFTKECQLLRQLKNFEKKEEGQYKLLNKKTGSKILKNI